MSSLENQFDEKVADRFWRSIDELSQTPGVLENLRREHPDVHQQELSAISRRQFARLMAASFALAGAAATGCRRWPEQFVRPQSERKEGFLPGVPEYFATQFELDGFATGILAKSVDGRPIKIEGNDLHPFSQGAAGVFAQASVLELYAPDRTRGYIYRPENAPANDALVSETAGTKFPTEYSRQSFVSSIEPHFAAYQANNGRGLHVLAPTHGSPTFRRLREAFHLKYPQAEWHVFQPIDRDNELAGTKRVFGRALRPQFELSKASTIVCLDVDLMGSHPAHQKWCRDWAAGRNPDAQQYSRMWSFESGYSTTGAAADIRHPVAPSEIMAIAKAIARGIGVPVEKVEVEPRLHRPIQQLVKELKSSGPRGLLVAGPSQPVEVHAIVHAINHHLACVGTTVSYTEEPMAEGKTSVQAISELAASLRGNAVETLLILGGNPAYDAPADLKFDLKGRSRLTSIYLGLFDNETAQQCTWHVPAAHYLEAWNDGQAWDGTYGIGQPLIYPLFDGISPIEMLSIVIGSTVGNGMDLVRETATQFGVDSDKKWNRLLHDGVLVDSQFKPVKVGFKNEVVSLAASQNGKMNVRANAFDICFTPDASTYDGRFANNGWLQELPDPLTKLTWDNAALMSKHDADEQGLASGDTISIEVSADLRIEEVPVLVQPGQALGTISLPLGYGRQSGMIAKGVGVNVNSIRTSQGLHFVQASISKTGRYHKLACTQEHHLVDPVGMAGREFRVGEQAKPGSLVRETTLQRHQRDPHAVHAGFHVPKAAPMFDQPDRFDSPSSWGMAIDLNSCVGCNACVVACQAENNIPVVGKANVLQNREMHWLRIDRYFKGDVESPDAVHVPMACAHCEDAPCEQVCPVAATVHDTEGLNAMVYNRCVGTRYCANNCPYKVRRFNYYDYHSSRPKVPAQPWIDVPDKQSTSEISQLEQMLFNPEVSVRMRGVMEKCTYCVQRISQARIEARNGHAKGERDSTLSDGEVVTACQQACPTRAIRFGDLNDENSEVSKAHRDERAYSMLEETNIKPRTRFLARIRNVDGKDSTEEVNHGHG